MSSFFEFLRTLSLFLISAYLVFRWHRKKLYQFASKISELPSALPVIGILYKCIGKSKGEMASMALELAKKMDPLVKFWLGPKLVLILNDPRDIEITLNSPHCIQKSVFYNFLKFRKGLITLPADEWKRHRKYLNASFNTKILKSFIPIFNEKAKILSETLETHIGNGEFDFFDYSIRCTLDMITSTSLGGKYNYQTDRDSGKEFHTMIATYMKMVSLRAFNVLHHIEWIYNLSKNSKIFKISTDYMYKYSGSIMRRRRIEMELEGNNSSQLNESDEFRKPQIFIDQLLYLSKTQPEIFDDDAIIQETGMALIAGFDTSAITVSNTILLLACHPEIQEKVYAELNEVFFNVDEQPDYDIVSKLEYMERVIKESLRLFPIGSILARETTNEQPLASQNLTIPAGVSLFYSIITLHRDPKHWGPDANVFNPERFTPENSKNRHPCVYLPFSAGPRNCIGGRYAMISLKIILAHILRKYKFSTSYTYEKISPKFGITMKLSHPHSVSIEYRN